MLWGLVGLAALPFVGALGLWLYARALQPDLPTYDELAHPDLALSSVAYTADGEELARYHRHNRTWVGLDRIARRVPEALVATEDARFYAHRGVDWRRLLASVYFTARGRTQGGSTIAMQLARNLFPERIGSALSIPRKLKEILTAQALEQAYTKPQILELYLNTMPFGYNTFGVEAAAQVFFSKSAARLTDAEAALLVGMLKGATRYNPVTNPEAALDRRALVARRLAGSGRITAAEAEAIAAAPLGLRFRVPNPHDSPAPHFADYVAEWVQAWCAERGCDLYKDGLRVHTTLDSRLQRVAQTAVEAEAAGLQAVADYEWSRAAPGTVGSAAAARAAVGPRGAFAYFWSSKRALVDGYVRATPRFRSLVAGGTAEAAALRRLRADAAFMDSLRAVRTRLEASLVAVEPGTGYVRAWVGGRDYARDQYDHVGKAKRQPGSTFKAFVYTAAVDWGYRPDDRLRDEVRTYNDGPGDSWTPTNSGGASGADLTLRQALTYSKNTISARLVHEIGPGYVARMAHKMGVVSPLREVPSIALGTSEVTLLELVAGYGTLAAGGLRHVPLVVTRIEDREGNVIGSFEPTGERAVASSTAYTVLDMLRGVVNEGTGAGVRSRYGLGGDLAGKTGTTQANADGWFVLMHPRLVVGAWVGFNDRRIAFRSSHWGQGGVGALSLVGRFVQRAKATRGVSLPDSARFEPPLGYDDLMSAPSWFDDQSASPDAPDELGAPDEPLPDLEPWAPPADLDAPDEADARRAAEEAKAAGREPAPVEPAPRAERPPPAPAPAPAPRRRIGW